MKNTNQEVENWFYENEEQVHALWQEHLIFMEDLWEHVKYITQNEDAFWEFVEDEYYKMKDGE